MLGHKLENPITIKQKARYPRFVYLVKEKDSSIILDAIFADSYHRWGGLKTIIVPVVNGKIHKSYLDWVKLHDPDVIYSYADLNQDTIDILNKQNNPFVFLEHKNCCRRELFDNEHIYWRPQYNFNFVTSLSLAPFIFKEFKKHFNFEKYYFLQNNIDGMDDGFIADNFGFFSTGFEARRLLEIDKNARALNLRSKNPNCQSDRNIEQVIDAKYLLKKMISNDGSFICTPAYFSSVLTKSTWIARQPVRIFVGDSFNDRLNFWNCRYACDKNHYHSPSNVAIRLTKENIEDKEFLDVFRQYLIWLGRNSNLDSYSLISYSLDDNQLKYVEEKLKFGLSISITKALPMIPHYDILPSQEYEHEKEYQIETNSFSFSATKPYHFQFLNFDSIQLLEYGQWVVDLEIQRHNNLNFTYEGVKFKEKSKQSWKLPRNKAVVQAFMPYLPKERGRVSLSRNISFINNISICYDKEQKEKIYLPEDCEIFCEIFDSLWELPNKYFEKERLNWIFRTSDKGKSLEKMIKLFGGLYEAFCYMDDPLWQKMLSELKDGGYISEPILKEKTRRLFLEEKEIIIRRNTKTKVSEMKALAVKGIIEKTKCDKCSVSSDITNSKKTCHNCKYSIPKAVCVDLENCFHELWILGSLLKKSPCTFFYLPQTTIQYSSNKNDNNEIDIMCVAEGKLIIGEAKTNIAGFTEQCMDKIIKIAHSIRADIVILTYVEDNNDQDKCVQLKKTLELHGFETKLIKTFSTERLSIF